VSRKWSFADFATQRRSNVPNWTISVQESVIFQVVYSQDNLYHIKCAYPPSHLLSGSANWFEHRCYSYQGTSKRYAADISKKNVLVGFTRKSLFLVDMPSNSLAPLEVIQNIVDQVFILLSI